MIRGTCKVPKKHQDKQWPTKFVGVPLIGQEVQEVGRAGDTLKSLVVQQVRYCEEPKATEPTIQVDLKGDE